MAPRISIWLAVILGISLDCDKTHASTISLTSSPASISPYLTHDLTLRCGLTDDGQGQGQGQGNTSSVTSPSGGGSQIIGKKRAVPAGGIQETRGLTHTLDDVRAVTSLLLTRDGVDVASVSDYVAAQPLADLGKVKVQGHVDNSAVGEKGHLTATWSYPNMTQGGNYTCTVHALDDLGHAITFTNSVLVDVVDPTLGDLVKAVYGMQVREDSLETDNKHLKSQVASLQVQVSAQQSQLVESRHIENGSLDFGDARLWSDGRIQHPGDEYNYTYRYKDISVQFSRPYKTAPIVHVGLDDAWIDKEYFAYYFVDLLSVDVAGFTVRSSIKDFGTFYIDLRLNWLSLPTTL